MSRSQYHSEKLSISYTKTAARIIACYEGDERKAQLAELQKIVENNSIQMQKLKYARDLKNRVGCMSTNEENDQNDGAVDIIQEYKRGIARFKTAESKSEMVMEFERQIKALLQGKEADQHNGNDDDEDMQLTGGYVNVIDPISKKRMVNPVKNSVCGHTYDSQGIMDLLKMNKRTRCPVVGCRSKEYVIATNLKQDIVTQTYLDQNPE